MSLLRIEARKLVTVHPASSEIRLVGVGVMVPTSIVKLLLVISSIAKAESKKISIKRNTSHRSNFFIECKRGV